MQGDEGRKRTYDKYIIIIYIYIYIYIYIKKEGVEAGKSTMTSIQA